MNLTDPKFAAQVRKVTLIFSGITMAMSAAAAGLSLYTLNMIREREHYEDVLAHPRQFPEETKMVDCLMDGEVTPAPRIFCEYFGGEVTEPR